MLVVEDEPALRTTLSATLTLVGFSVQQAETVEIALGLLDRVRIDAIILDLWLPDRSGMSLLSFLRTTTAYSHLPVIVFTGVPLSTEEETIIRKHNAEIIYKPVSYAKVIERLSRMLRDDAGPEGSRIEGIDDARVHRPTDDRE